VITPTTAVTRWTGESMDYGTATDALLYQTHHATRFQPPTDVSAETGRTHEHGEQLKTEKQPH
jgi:hypothetical protein